MDKKNLPMKPFQKISLITAFAVTLGTPLWFAVAALGTKFGLWHFSFGLIKMTFTWGPKLLMGATAACLISLILQLASSPRRGAVWALIPVIACSMMLLYFISTIKTSLALPPIHDIQTDWKDPVPAPGELTALRKEKGFNPIIDNPVVPESAKGTWPGMVGKSNAELQQKHYGFVVPKISTRSCEKLFKIALNTAEQKGWKIEKINESSKSRIIHATFTSIWYGFTDDILIRISSLENGGSKLDIRSISRVGLSDLGANASRIKKYLKDLEPLSNK